MGSKLRLVKMHLLILFFLDDGYGRVLFQLDIRVYSWAITFQISFLRVYRFYKTKTTFLQSDKRVLQNYIVSVPTSPRNMS